MNITDAIFQPEGEYELMFIFPDATQYRDENGIILDVRLLAMLFIGARMMEC